MFCLDFTRIWSNPYAGMIRLSGGSHSNEGRVEVYCNGRWGTICSASLDSTDYSSICKQLGYNDYFKTSFMTRYYTCCIAWLLWKMLI